MIARPIKGTGFRGVLNYLSQKPDAELFLTPMAGRDSRELAREFGLVRRQRPRLEKAVAHLFLRPAPGEFLSDEQWREVVRFYVAGMGFADSPYVVYRHNEPHPHLHIVASRVTYDGRVVSDSNDYRCSGELCRQIERDYGLRVLRSPAHDTAPSLAEFGRARRAGGSPPRTYVQEVLARVPSERRFTLSDYLDYLHRHEIALLPNLARTGHVSGVSYVYKGTAFRGSDLGRDYSWSALRSRLVPRSTDAALLASERSRALAELPLRPVSPPLEAPPRRSAPPERPPTDPGASSRADRGRRAVETEVRELSKADLASAFTAAHERYTPRPLYLPAPEPAEIPKLAAEAQAASRRLAETTRALQRSTPTSFPALALEHANRLAERERIGQRLSTLAPPLPRDLPRGRHALYLEAHLKLQEAREAPPSAARDLRIASHEARIRELAPRSASAMAPVSEDQVKRALAHERHAQREVRLLLVSPPPSAKPEAFARAVERAARSQTALQDLGLRLEHQLRVLSREHTAIRARAPYNRADSRYLDRIEERIAKLEPLYQRTRLALLDRDLERLGRYLRQTPSPTLLDRYGDLVRRRATIATALSDSNPRRHASTIDTAKTALRQAVVRRLDPQKLPSFETARVAVLKAPTPENLARYRRAVASSTHLSLRDAFSRAQASVAQHRATLVRAYRDANLRTAHPLRSAASTNADLRRAAQGYLDARLRLGDHEPRPPRLSSTLARVRLAEASDLAPGALASLRRGAMRDLRGSAPPPPPHRAPRVPGANPQTERLAAVRELRQAEALLFRQLRGIRNQHVLGAPPPRLLPGQAFQLVHAIDRYQKALDDLRRVTRASALSPRQFLDHVRDDAQKALHFWAASAARNGLSLSEIRSALTRYPYFAATSALAVARFVQKLGRDERAHEHER
jgi:relaxase-like protein